LQFIRDYPAISVLPDDADVKFFRPCPQRNLDQPRFYQRVFSPAARRFNAREALQLVSADIFSQ